MITIMMEAIISFLFFIFFSRLQLSLSFGNYVFDFYEYDTKIYLLLLVKYFLFTEYLYLKFLFRDFLVEFSKFYFYFFVIIENEQPSESNNLRWKSSWRYSYERN